VSLVLAFDASTARSTAAIVRDGAVVAAGEALGRDPKEERLLPLILSLCSEIGVTVSDIDTIVVGSGPGSFTGLRIAAATAKGLATATGAILAPVSSLLLIVAGLPETPPCGRYLATLDALRGEHYVAEVLVSPGGMTQSQETQSQKTQSQKTQSQKIQGEITQVGPSRRVADADLPQIALEMGAAIVGPGMPWDAWPRAQGIARLTLPPAADLASWEPDYGRASAAEDRRQKPQ
jgi:tRNA threonylcarbamoyl adenosine modification protein YeaZ